MENFLRQVYQVKTNEVKMMRARGYRIPPELELLLTDRDEFIATVKKTKEDDSPLNQIYRPLPNWPIPRNPVYVIYAIAENINESEAKYRDGLKHRLIQVQRKEGVDEFIVITSESVKLSRKIAELMPNPTSRITVIDWKDFRYNIVEHVRVPKHVLLSSEERDQFLKEHHLEGHNLPAISINDPISIYYAAIPRQIFKVYRRNHIGPSLRKNLIFYREVREIIVTGKEEEPEEEGELDLEGVPQLFIPELPAAQ